MFIVADLVSLKHRIYFCRDLILPAVVSGSKDIRYWQKYEYTMYRQNGKGEASLQEESVVITGRHIFLRVCVCVMLVLQKKCFFCKIEC